MRIICLAAAAALVASCGGGDEVESTADPAPSVPFEIGLGGSIRHAGDHALISRDDGTIAVVVGALDDVVEFGSPPAVDSGEWEVVAGGYDERDGGLVVLRGVCAEGSQLDDVGGCLDGRLEMLWTDSDHEWQVGELEVSDFPGHAFGDVRAAVTPIGDHRYVSATVEVDGAHESDPDRFRFVVWDVTDPEAPRPVDSGPFGASGLCGTGDDIIVLSGRSVDVPDVPDVGLDLVTSEIVLQSIGESGGASTSYRTTDTTAEGLPLAPSRPECDPATGDVYTAAGSNIYRLEGGENELVASVDEWVKWMTIQNGQMLLEVGPADPEEYSIDTQTFVVLSLDDPKEQAVVTLESGVEYVGVADGRVIYQTPRGSEHPWELRAADTT